jgi:hypothetical protein
MMSLANHFISAARAAHPVSRAHVVWFQGLADKVVRERDARTEANRRKQAAKKQALSKLTDEEAQALGHRKDES